MNFLKAISIATCLVVSTSGFAQPEGWTVNPNAFQFTMSLTFSTEVNGITGMENMWVGFFDENGICRGVGEASFFNPGTGWYTGLMLVHSNQAVESDLEAMLWNASSDEILASSTELSFVADGSVGDFGTPFIIQAAEDPLVGCTNPLACNYSETAITDNGSCVLPACMDESACNFDPTAVCEAEDSCTYPEPHYDCNGNCLNDADSDGICDEYEVVGCMEPAACNYNAAATESDCSCTFPSYPYDCDGECFLDSDGDGVCDGFEIMGCTSTDACNYQVNATEDDGTCEFCCFASTVDNGFSLLIELDATDEMGLNRYRMYVLTPSANSRVLAVGSGDLATLITSTEAFHQEELGGVFAHDISQELLESAPSLQWDSWVTIGVEPGLPVLPENLPYPTGSPVWQMLFELGENIYLSGNGSDGWAIDAASNLGYPDEDSRVLIAQFSTSGELSGQVHLVAQSDAAGSELESIVLSFTAPSCGCMDEAACNYSASAAHDDGQCVYPEEGLDCDGDCIADQDADGVCDADEISGCTQATAYNFNAEATDDDGSCLSMGCTYSAATNYDADAVIDDQSCLFEFVEMLSCPDLDMDGVVGTSDLLLFLTSFGNTCSP